MLGLPVLSLRVPDTDLIERIRLASESEPLSYEAVGATERGPLPEGWIHDDDDIVLGRGPEVFARARAAVFGWHMFDPPWLCMPVREPPMAGLTVAFASRQLGLWAVHTCRVVYVLDTPDTAGFAYGTLRNHAVAGEERFCVRWDRESDQVSFGILKFSLLVSTGVRLVGGTARRLQQQFSTDACEAIRRLVCA